jgi:hypothetical protein
MDDAGKGIISKVGAVETYWEIFHRFQNNHTEPSIS